MQSTLSVAASMIRPEKKNQGSVAKIKESVYLPVIYGHFLVVILIENRERHWSPFSQSPFCGGYDLLTLG